MPYTVLVGKIGVHNQASVVQRQRYQNTFFLVFFDFQQTDRNVGALKHFHSRCATRLKDVAIREYLCICLRLVLIKGELVLIFRTNGRFPTKQIVFKVKVENFTVNFGLFLFKLNQFSREARLTCPLLDQNKTFESDASLSYHKKRSFFCSVSNLVILS